MSKKITSKITTWEVVAKSAAQPTAEVIEMHERIVRPGSLVGSTYKVKTPNSDSALYITINDIVLNEGTVHERRQPFEIFINSKNMEYFQWVSAFTLLISAVFRKGGDVTFIVDELAEVFDPKGGYFSRGKFIPSVVAEIGEVIREHMVSIGLIKPVGLTEVQMAVINEKKAQYLAKVAAASGAGADPDTGAEADGPGIPGAKVCNKCRAKAVILMDGCDTCTSCGASKCG